MKRKKPSKVMSWFSRPTFDISRALEHKAADVRRKMVAKKAELEADDDIEAVETEEEWRARRERFEALYGDRIKGMTNVNDILKALYPDGSLL